MRNLSLSLLLTSLSLVFGCTSSPNSNKPTNKEVETAEIEKSTAERKVDVFDMPPIKTLYVTNLNGSLIHEKPDQQSVVLDSLVYGHKVEVIGETGDWYQIKERVGRSFIRNGQQIESAGWEIVNIPKTDTGPLTQVKLTAKDLYQTIDNVPVNGKVSISIITKREFERSRTEKDKFVIPRRELISVKDSVLTVTLLGNKQKKKYVSTPNAEDQMEVYGYVGHVDILNSYLLAMEYYEGRGYTLYHAASGEEMVSFNDYPFISPDGKFIVSMYSNPYEQTTDFQLYQIGDNKKIIKPLEASFNKWMAALEPQAIYWQDATTFVVKVLHAQAFWNEDGDLNKEHQYLKVKIL